MAPKSERPKRGDRALPLLNLAIEGLNLAKEISSATPAKAVFGTVSALRYHQSMFPPIHYDNYPWIHVHLGLCG